MRGIVAERFDLRGCVQVVGVGAIFPERPIGPRACPCARELSSGISASFRFGARPIAAVLRQRSCAAPLGAELRSSESRLMAAVPFMPLRAIPWADRPLCVGGPDSDAYHLYVGGIGRM